MSPSTDSRKAHPSGESSQNVTYSHSFSTASPDSGRTRNIWSGIGRQNFYSKTALIYLDHNATTPVLPEVAETMIPWLTTNWGNPSSIHAPGRAARRAIEEARSKVATLVGAYPEQVLFTSGATEANNSAIHSVLIHDPTKRHIVTSVVEHSAILTYCDFVKRHHGVEITCLPVDAYGMISNDDLKAAIRPDTALVSLMWANNETGVIWPIAEFSKICGDAGVPFHTDAVQAIGKVPVHFGKCGASFLSISGHKIGSPKGIGALILSEPTSFEPLIYGGKQERGMRGGTENVPLIVALGAAAEIVSQRDAGCWNPIKKLRDEFEQMLIQRIPRAAINGGGTERLPNTSNVYLPGLDGEAMVTFLDQQGICVSSGSACMESAITPSHVIHAMTKSYARASESIRVSLGQESTNKVLQRLVKSLETFTSMNFL
jgi:cysteine desulfurase